MLDMLVRTLSYESILNELGKDEMIMIIMKNYEKQHILITVALNCSFSW